MRTTAGCANTSGQRMLTKSRVTSSKIAPFPEGIWPHLITGSRGPSWLSSRVVSMLEPTARFMTHVIYRLTAKNRDQLRNPTLGNRVWATFFRPTQVHIPNGISISSATSAQSMAGTNRHTDQGTSVTRGHSSALCACDAAYECKCPAHKKVKVAHTRLPSVGFRS